MSLRAAVTAGCYIHPLRKLLLVVVVVVVYMKFQDIFLAGSICLEVFPRSLSLLLLSQSLSA
jgi:hypothetical protein